MLGSLLLAACGSVRAPAAGTAGAAPARASGSPSASGTGTGAGSAMAALCQDTATVTSLQIVRLPGLRVPQAQTAFPNGFAAIGPAGARAVARALCALPVMPRGIMSCPALFPGTSYQLRFTAAGRSLPPVTVEATGCDTVTGDRPGAPGHLGQVLAGAGHGGGPEPARPVGFQHGLRAARLPDQDQRLPGAGPARRPACAGRG